MLDSCPYLREFKGIELYIDMTETMSLNSITTVVIREVLLARMDTSQTDMVTDGPS